MYNDFEILEADEDEHMDNKLQNNNSRPSNKHVKEANIKEKVE